MTKRIRKEPIDITGKIGELYPDTKEPEWPMYSYGRPARLFWNGIAIALDKRGWSEEQVKTFLQSINARHWLDSQEELIESLAIGVASTIPQSWEHIA